MNNEYKKLGRNTMWMTLGSFSSKLLLFFMAPIYTSYLTTADYGLGDLMTTMVSLLTPFLSLAASEGVIRFTLDDNNEKKNVFSLVFFILLTGTIILLLVMPIILPYTPFKNLYCYFFCYYFFSTITMVVQQFVKGLGHVRQYAISGILSTLVIVFLNLLLLIGFGFGVKGYILSIVGGNFVALIYLIYSEKVYIYIEWPNKIPILLVKQYLLYCMPLIPNQISWWINNSSDKFILTYYWGNSVNGIYSVAYKIPSLLNMIATIFYASWQISAVDDFGSKKSIKFFSDVYKKYYALFIISASLVILIIKQLAFLLFANDFYLAWKYSVILIIASMLQAMGSFIGTIYISAMKSGAIFVTTAFSAILNTILNFILIPQYGAYGAAIATTIAYLSILILRDFDSRKILPIEIDYKHNIVSYLMLTMQAIITCLDIRCSLVVSFLIFICITYMNRTIIDDIYSIIKNIGKGDK